MQAKRSRWKRVSLILLKIYSGICTFVVSGVILIVVWEVEIAAKQQPQAPHQGQSSTPPNNAWLESISNIQLSLDPIYINPREEPLSLLAQRTNESLELAPRGSGNHKTR